MKTEIVETISVFYACICGILSPEGDNMCTAVSYMAGSHFFGRNLDLEHSYIEAVTITPRNYPLHFRKVSSMRHHYAMIGMAAVVDGYPLYYDATNEHGLSMAGLNFPGNAVYQAQKNNVDNITPFEFVPWILGHCKTIPEVRQKLSHINLVSIPFNNELPLSPLHWMISDKTETIVVEPMESGIVIYDDPVGVLTNNPPFPYHMHNLCNYLNLTHKEPTNRFADKIELKAYSRGLGSFGLPGDLSSASRFVKAAFTKLNSISDGTENSDVSQFFHILGAVTQQRGCVKVGNGFERTVYSSCCNTDRGIYHYTTYENNQITAVDMHRENLDSDKLYCFPLITDQQIRFEN